MNWWRVPEYGPVNPSARSLRMKSRRLSGRHPAMLNLVQINASENRKFVTQPQADKNPILQTRAQFVLTLAKRLAERDDAFKFRNLARERTVFELVVSGQFHRRFDIGCEWKRHDGTVSYFIGQTSLLQELGSHLLTFLGQPFRLRPWCTKIEALRTCGSWLVSRRVSVENRAE